MMDKQKLVSEALDNLRIELPSWGFANTGTRFGKFLQAAAATTLEDKFSDAARVHRLTGSCPTIALHAQWDLPNGIDDVPRVLQLAQAFGIRAGSINPNLFQDQEYKYGSVCNPDPTVRQRAIDHILLCIEIAKRLGSRDICPWFADGSSYPGTQSIYRRIGWIEEAVKVAHAHLDPDQRLLIEYKPFEPFFYHTDVADWGMALSLAQAAGPRALVLVDTGHHYQAQNVEQIVTWLLHLNLLGGFHFNDRRYADDDLTLGSIDPYQVFRIFHEILNYRFETGATADVAFMIDQSHNLKGKIEAMIQTICTAQELYARAALVDRERLVAAQSACHLIRAEEIFRNAFWFDVKPLVVEWRRSKGLPSDPLEEFDKSDYLERISAEREERNMKAITSYA
ncbi:MAG TPA: TIM barrel protein [Terracidiphilus sp.]|nr:TIM barrel protein [Terracidiphilus sp.]